MPVLYDDKWLHPKKITRDVWFALTDEQRLSALAVFEDYVKEVNQKNVEIGTKYRVIKDLVQELYGAKSPVFKYIEKHNPDVEHLYVWKPYRDAYDNWEKERIALIAKKEQEKVKEEQLQKQKEIEIAKERKMAVVAYKYNLGDNWCKEDIYEFLINKCKYLNLAIAMERTRNNWSEGFYRVDYALDDFVKSNDSNYTPIDELIVTSLRDILDDSYNDVIDGRCFKDCEYNYYVLYAMAKEHDSEAYELFDGIFMKEEL